MIISHEQQPYTHTHTHTHTHTNNRINLQSLNNTKNHNYLIEEIRKTSIALEKHNWKITFKLINPTQGSRGTS